ncbi:MAG: CBS domain-containing protein [Candidatus Woesearchaeota archaeon]|jgi:CBS domain-containing protein/sporulation protein YlmC with PRC-barrel domain
MVFYTELFNQDVIDSEKKILGKLCDLVFVDGLESAKIIYFVFLAKDNYKKRVSWDYVQGIKQDTVTGIFSISLNTISSNVDFTFVHEHDLLAHELLDKQIIDVAGVKVVRVNDLLLNKVDEELCITGVCVGTTSFFRRLGVKQNVFGRFIYSMTSERIIPWKFVEPLEVNKHLHLKESHTKIAEMHPGDIADLMGELTPKEQMIIFNKLDKKTAAKTLVEAQPEVQESFFKGLKVPRIVELLESMPVYKAADLLILMDQEKAKFILQHMSPEKAKSIQELHQYPENSAGALMRTDVFTLYDDLTATQAISYIKKSKPSADKIHVLFVIDHDHHLVGTLSVRTLLNASPRQKLKLSMKKHPMAVGLSATKQDIAIALEKYNFYVIPVIDESSKLKGMITADEILTKVIPESWIRRKLIIKRAKRKHKIDPKLDLKLELKSGGINGQI